MVTLGGEPKISSDEPLIGDRSAPSSSTTNLSLILLDCKKPTLAISPLHPLRPYSLFPFFIYQKLRFLYLSTILLISLSLDEYPLVVPCILFG
jgi:hypothetical protein